MEALVVSARRCFPWSCIILALLLPTFQVVEYMQRAEELKENLKARNRDRTPGLPTSSPDEVLGKYDNISRQ